MLTGSESGETVGAVSEVVLLVVLMLCEVAPECVFAEVEVVVG